VGAAPARQVVEAAHGLPAARALPKLLPGAFGERAEDDHLGLGFPLARECKPTLGRGQLRPRLLECAGRCREGGLERGPRAFLGLFFEAALEELDEGEPRSSPVSRRPLRTEELLTAAGPTGRLRLPLRETPVEEKGG
jgi:hypothetical protein